MDLLIAVFPQSGVETYVFIPPLVAFVISFFTSLGGLSGAFLLLPFQMSVLGFTSPSVSATNFLYNIVGIPAGVCRHVKEGRMSWPLVAVIAAGTIPGLVAGYYLRVRYLPEPGAFKFFVGLVLLYVGLRLIAGTRSRFTAPAASAGTFRIETARAGLKRVEYDFDGKRYSFSVPALFMLSAVVGVVGGIYGIGGGAIIAPFCVSVFGLPVHTVAGAALMGTFLTSIYGVAVYSWLPLYGGTVHPPDWWLGILFGVGGLAGIYCGARVQRHVPERVIRMILAAGVLFVSARYIMQFIMR